MPIVGIGVFIMYDHRGPPAREKRPWGRAFGAPPGALSGSGRLPDTGPPQARYTAPMTALPSVDRALALVLEAAPALPVETIAFRDGLGRILQEEIRAGYDYPSFDKSLMDGYAVRASDLQSAPSDLKVGQEIPAGTDPARLVRLEPGVAARIMTGAPLPPEADAVFIVEDTEPVPGRPGLVRALKPVGPGDNLARRGEDVRRGDVLLHRGDWIGPGEIGVLAACGRTQVRVGGRPRAAVLATGDELVEPDRSPGSGRIRNSNGPLLDALARRAGAEVLNLGIARDEEPALRAAIKRGLSGDILLISGGVSMGVYDLVGKVLRSLGVEILFEKVAIKPGRPFTFGRHGKTLIFGCPGNPASCYVIFQVFARPALRKMMGHAEPVLSPVRGVLETPVRRRPGRAGYFQARARWTGDGFAARVLPTSGSADFVSCARGNALVIAPVGDGMMAVGDPVDLLLLDDHTDR